MERMQSKFRCNVKRDDVSVRSNLGPTFWTFSIIEERVADKVEIDIDDIFADMPGLESLDAETDLDMDMDSDSSTDSGTDTDDDEGNKDYHDPEVETDNTPTPGPLKGYEYTPFIPRDAPRKLVGHMHASPTIQQALAALKDLESKIRPKRQKGPGYRDPELDL